MKSFKDAFRIVFIYFGFSLCWIFFSDAIVEFFVKDVNRLSTIQTYKGIFFVSVTSLLLLVLIRLNLLKIYTMQKKIKENEQRLKYVVQGANLGYWDWDYVTNKHLVNDTWLSFLGLRREDIKEDVTDWSELIHPDDKMMTQKTIQETIQSGKPYVMEFRMRHRDGHWVWIEGSGAVVKHYEQTGKPIRLAGTHRDISDRKYAEEKILFLALNDPLTKLPNRIFLKQELEKMLQREKEMAFLFLDLDYFKNINDIYGHSVGDRVIKEVSLRFKNSLSEGDFLSRVGGDEFVVLTKEFEHVHSLCESLIKSLEEPFDIVEDKFKLSVSIGIAMFPKDGEDFEMLFKNADTAMYAAKSSGKNRHKFYLQDMTDVIFKSTKMDNEMQRAIEQDEFVLHYQPQVDLQTGDVIGVEALVRWNDPLKGLVPPYEFIPRAEDNRLIIPLGELIFKKALNQLKQWQDNNIFNGVVAVNISGVQIGEVDFVEKLEAIRQEIGVSASKIELEVTESYIMKNAKESIATLQKLKNLGFGISVDDFGTGYSSLSYLKQLPIHKLKIDRSFIKDLPHDNEDRAISRAIIALGKSLELEVLAEGIETKEQQDFLLMNGCDRAQGYFFAKPMDADAFATFVQHN